MDTSTVVERFREIDREQFTPEVDQLWVACGQIKDAISEQVTDGNIPPLTALGMLSCITAQAFGYQLFHGQPAPADLVGASLLGNGR